MAPERGHRGGQGLGLRGRGEPGSRPAPSGRSSRRTPASPCTWWCNFDESEPGTFNNRELVERDPHQLLEGAIICALRRPLPPAFIYCRGSSSGRGRARAGDRRGVRRGLLGANLGAPTTPSTWCCTGARGLHLRRGDGAARVAGGYRASLGCVRRSPRSRGCTPSPTVINNVETLSNVPHILTVAPMVRLDRDREVYRPGRVLVSGKVERPGTTRRPMGPRPAS
jgi:NADH-quinone oxidoreductase subunit F